MPEKKATLGPTPSPLGPGNNSDGNGGTDRKGMMFQPINPIEHRVTVSQGGLKWRGMLRQGAPLHLDAHLQRTMTGGQFQKFRIHSGFFAG